MNTSCESTSISISAYGAAIRHLSHSAGDFTPRELDSVRTVMAEQLEKHRSGPAKVAGSYQIMTGGSMLRARLALASCTAFGRSRRYRIASAAACELIHNASLIHDDLIDRDEDRRSAPTVWKEFGDNVALCTGDLLLCSAFGVASSLENAEESQALSRLLAKLTAEIVVGQSIEVGSTAQHCSPGFRDYLDATTAKTAPLIELALMSGAIGTKKEKAASGLIDRLSASVGLAYQIVDDLDDITQQDSNLHTFHAWHFHRIGRRTEPEARIHRATHHALSALQRGRRLVAQLDSSLDNPIGTQVLPLIAKLEQRAESHRRDAESQGCSSNDGVTAI